MSWDTVRVLSRGCCSNHLHWHSSIMPLSYGVNDVTWWFDLFNYTTGVPPSYSSTETYCVEKNELRHRRESWHWSHPFLEYSILVLSSNDFPSKIYWGLFLSRNCCILWAILVLRPTVLPDQKWVPPSPMMVGTANTLPPWPSLLNKSQITINMVLLNCLYLY